MRWAAAALVLAACAGDGDDGNDRCAGTSCAPGSLIWAGQAGSEARVRVTAVAASPGEPPWFAGTFAGSLTLDEVATFRAASGEDDVFVARIGARATVSPWLVVARTAAAVRVAGVIPDFEEGALVVTEGALDDRWSVGAVAIAHNYHEVVDEPRPLVALTAPGERGIAAVTAVDAAGWPLVAISGDFEGTRRAVLHRVGQGLLTEPLFEIAGVEINDVAPGTRDTVVIGGRYTGAPPDWPACPEISCGFAAIIDARADRAAPLLSLEVFRATGGAEVLAVGPGTLGLGPEPFGGFTALVRVDGVTLEPSVAVEPQPTLYLAVGEAEAVNVRTLSTTPNLMLSGAALEATATGAVVALAFNGEIFVDGGDVDTVASDASGDRDVVIAEYPSDADEPGWHLLVRTDGTADVSALAVKDDQVAVGGNYTGQLSIATGTVLGRTPDGIDGPVPQGFVLELIR